MSNNYRWKLVLTFEEVEHLTRDEQVELFEKLRIATAKILVDYKVGMELK